MSSKKARSRGARTPASRFRNWKFLAIVAGVTAAVVVALVLIPGTLRTPDEDVVAMVNGRKITSEDVTLMRVRHVAFNNPIDPDQALQQLIVDTLLYEEAHREGYMLTSEEAEQELEAQLEAEGFTLAAFKDDLDLYGISYSDFLDTFSRELAIGKYLDDAVAVTEDEAIERYEQYVEEYAKIPNLEIPPFEEVRTQIVMELEQENRVRLIRELVEKADITRYTDPG